MRQRKHTEHPVAGLEKRYPGECEADVAPKISESNHHSFGITRRAGSIVNQSQLTRLTPGKFHLSRGEFLAVGFQKRIFQPVDSRRQLMFAAKGHREIRNKHHTINTGHIFSIKFVINPLFAEKQPRFRMGDKSLDRVGMELMQQRHHHSPICQRPKECSGPRSRILGTQSHLFSRLQPYSRKNKMHLNDTPRHMAVAHRLSFEIRQCRQIPIPPYARFKSFIQTFHNLPFFSHKQTFSNIPAPQIF